MFGSFRVRRWWLLAVAVLIVFPACSNPDDSSAQEVVEAYFDAWNARDVDQVMSYVADDASLEIEPVGVMWSDPEEIRAAFEAMFARSEWTVSVSGFETVDEATVAYNYEIVSPDGTVLERGRSQATIEDGLVKTERAIGAFREEKE